jgi:hypothetical protein
MWWALDPNFIYGGQLAPAAKDNLVWIEEVYGKILTEAEL